MMKTRELLLAMVDLWTITLVDPSELVMFIRDVPGVGAADFLGYSSFIELSVLAVASLYSMGSVGLWGPLQV